MAPAPCSSRSSSLHDQPNSCPLVAGASNGKCSEVDGVDGDPIGGKDGGHASGSHCASCGSAVLGLLEKCSSCSRPLCAACVGERRMANDPCFAMVCDEEPCCIGLHSGHLIVCCRMLFGMHVKNIRLLAVSTGNGDGVELEAVCAPCLAGMDRLAAAHTPATEKALCLPNLGVLRRLEAAAVPCLPSLCNAYWK